MKFEEVLTTLRAGKKIRRKSWGDKNYYIFLDGSGYICGSDDYSFAFEYCDFIANNWEIYEEPLLMEEEKRYLKEVCRPFKNKILYICKSSPSNSEYSNINIVLEPLIKNSDYANVCSLPRFKNGTMYNNLDNERHTLDELGIRYEKSNKR